MDQTVLMLHFGVNGNEKGREGLLSCPHFLNMLLLGQKEKKCFPLTNPRGVRVTSIRSEFVFYVKEKHLSVVRVMILFTVCQSCRSCFFLEVSSVSGEISSVFRLHALVTLL